jgi:hypothetical protein
LISIQTNIDVISLTKLADLSFLTGRERLELTSLWCYFSVFGWYEKDLRIFCLRGATFSPIQANNALVQCKVSSSAMQSFIQCNAKSNVTGAYTLVSQTPAWTFGGSVGQTLTNLAVNTGRDKIGSYQEIDFNYVDKNAASRGGGIRAYNNKPIAMFIDSYLSASANNAPFPHLTTYPGNLYHLTYSGIFAQEKFTHFGYDSPWLFFDAQEHTFVLSPASDFMVASTKMALNGSISSGITSVITTLPTGFKHKTFLVVGQGFNKVEQMWGHAMTDLQGKSRTANDADQTLNYLGYWTDHGATYYYSFDPNLGYAGTLLAVANSFKQKGIPLGYMQLDSWWYPKGSSDTWQGNGENRGGIYLYVAAPELFPNGLHAFQQQLGLPLVTHARWIDTSSPYRTQYLMSNNVSIDPKYWNMVASYLQNGGAISYEQDWLDSRATTLTNLTDPNAYLGDMASSMATSGLTIQSGTKHTHGRFHLHRLRRRDERLVCLRLRARDEYNRQFYTCIFGSHR